ncbi:MAG: methyltransferase domain-containing protein, partial [Gammaproteobacteria bacterium]
LERSRTAVNEADFNHVNFILGDTAVAAKKNLRYDLILFNMVLHHISSPARTFSDCAKLLNENGKLLIIELSSHDQDWVRESCGDLWLGFEEADLLHWAEKAELQHEQSSYLGLRNGFQIQMSVYRKGLAVEF